MGNYKNFEPEFVSRTVRLIDQYVALTTNVKFEDQLNYTLTINCLLGLIVMPKERIISFLPKARLTNELKAEMGLKESQLPGTDTTLRELITMMRHSVAHFDIDVISENDSELIDWLWFKNTESNKTYARFRATELLPFLRYYTNTVLKNLATHQKSAV